MFHWYILAHYTDVYKVNSDVTFQSEMYLSKLVVLLVKGALNPHIRLNWGVRCS